MKFNESYEEVLKTLFDLVWLTFMKLIKLDKGSWGSWRGFNIESIFYFIFISLHFLLSWKSWIGRKVGLK